MATPLRAGVIYLRRNGEALPLKGALTIKPGGASSEVKAGADGHPIVVATPTPGMIEGTITWDPKLNPSELQLGDNDTIAVGFRNGRRCVLSQGVYTGELELTTEENEIRVAWAGTITWD